MTVGNLSALIPGNLEPLHKHLKYANPSLSGLSGKALSLRNLSYAAGSLCILSTSASFLMPTENKELKSIAMIASGVLGTVTIIAANKALSSVNQLEQYLGVNKDLEWVPVVEGVPIGTAVLTIQARLRI